MADQLTSQTVRFAVLNDLHAQFEPGAAMAPGYDGANTRAEWLLAQVEPGGELSGLDFVVSGGDLIHGEDLPSIGVEMAALRERLRRLTVPFFPCCGNHEVKQAEGDPAFEEPYRRTFGEDRFDYAIPAGPAEIIVLNNAGTFHVGAARREARFEAFKRLLANRPGVPKILVCHVPLLPVRDNDTLRESFGFLSYKTLEVELVDTLELHGRDVRLVISGHLHLTGMVEHRGVRHLVTSGTASFPHDYPVITVTGKGIDVEVRSLPQALHEPGTNIHGRPRYPRDYTDSAHPDGDSYVRGNPGERRFFVSFGSG